MENNQVPSHRNTPDPNINKDLGSAAASTVRDELREKTVQQATAWANSHRYPGATHQQHTTRSDDKRRSRSPNPHERARRHRSRSPHPDQGGLGRRLAFPTPDETLGRSGSQSQADKAATMRPAGDIYARTTASVTTGADVVATSQRSATNTTGIGTREGPVTLILADLLIPGRGEPIRDGALASRNGKIEWVGRQDNIPATLQEEKKNAVSVPVLMPGLWDCCCYYLGLRGGLRMGTLGSHALLGAITAAELKATLQAGYTSVREWGGFAGQVKPAVEQGVLWGPNIYSSHSPIYITEKIEGKEDSLLDVAAVATPTGKVLANISIPCVPCHDLDQCVKSVSELIHRGASFISIFSRDTGGKTLSRQVIQAIIQEAAKSDRSVGARFFDGAAIKEALKAGLATIDNLLFIDQQTIELMEGSGALLISRQHCLGIFDADVLSGLPAEAAHRYRIDSQSIKHTFARALKSGVKIALGSGLVSSNNQDSKSLHGHNAHELVHAVEAGMTPLQAIECATANGPMTLGAMAPLSGQLKVGYDADFLLLKKNPLDDVSVLTHQENILCVYKGGKPCYF
ncbi:hypothetical protein ACRE_013090 [Hapsidospora chrysogenum ATCC 11550]|uniref:Amidohydrolase-related domain-containing protein n=1 Tax=Hapsidospora chrysogenum (strain ATCC 11550 / CBS 779.69 / DSM 880 / IAM 14645 / JCM 23072 / IMI 49137) TaxID=857340 RepID=A0A086TEB6_HAPC1|nr:hypothetical protein ACRE_013090 [Hapsidospora chrysogenum ATCC 11550]